MSVIFSPFTSAISAVLSPTCTIKCKRVPLGGRIFVRMPFRLCIFKCSQHLSPSEGPNRCVNYLGHAHAEADFVDGVCTHCESLAMGMLQS